MLRLLLAPAILTLAAGTAAAESGFFVLAESNKGGAAVQEVSADGKTIGGQAIHLNRVA
jgi:hypothetical protein